MPVPIGKLLRIVVDCKDCKHLRRAPFEARLEGCYHPELMRAKQKDAFLDEQQIPGNHEKVNLRGDCEHFEAAAKPTRWWQRLLSA